MKKITLRSIGAHLGVDCGSDLLIQGYRIDSRLSEAGDLFFALKGEKVDGHEFLNDAKERGALAACVLSTYNGPDFGLILLRVENVEAALKSLAKFSLSLKRPFIVGVTGSVGKTTTKDFIATLLEAKYTVAKTPQSYNSQLTFPLTILNREEEEVLVLEMGISQPGEMIQLVEIAPPDVAVLTKIALAHAEFFPNGIEQIAYEKKMIFSQPNTKVAILPKGSLELSKDKKIYFSEQDPNADYFLSVVDERGFIDEKGVRAYSFDLPFKEPHLLYNLLAAIAVARNLELSWDEIQSRLPSLRTPKMRFEMFEKEGICFVNDTYNANPESMRTALSSLPCPKEGGKRFAILADMRELGDFSASSHREIGHFAQKYVDHVLSFGKDSFLISESFSEAQKPSEHFSNKPDLITRLQELMRPGDVVLVKGSRSLAMESIFDCLFPPEKKEKF